MKSLLSLLLIFHSLSSVSAFIMPKSIALKSMSYNNNNNINHLIIRKGFNNNNNNNNNNNQGNNNNQNKSKIFKIEFSNDDELYNFDDNFMKLSIIICIYLYVNIWLIYIFFDIIKLIYI